MSTARPQAQPADTTDDPREPVTAASLLPSTLWDLVPASLSPFAAEAELGTRAWVRRLRMVRTEAAGRRFDAVRFGRLTGRTYGTANRADLRLTTDWMGWLFLLDDQADEGAEGRHPRRLEALLAGLVPLMPVNGAAGPTPVSARPLAAGLADLWRRTALATSPAWRRRFVRHMSDCFQAYCREAADRCSGLVPELAAFLRVRRAAGGMWPALDLIELVERVELPDALYRSRAFQALLTAVCDVTLWTNDLLTAEKARARSDVHNLVVVLQYAHGCTTQAAVDRVSAMLDHRMTRFLRAEQEVLGSAEFRRLSPRRQDDVLRCIRLTRAWMRGHLDWALESGYRDVEQCPPGRASGCLADLLPAGGPADGA
jgi:hypothetical protein